jgi:hypothetical protein
VNAPTPPRRLGPTGKPAGGDLLRWDLDAARAAASTCARHLDRLNDD